MSRSHYETNMHLSLTEVALIGVGHSGREMKIRTLTRIGSRDESCLSNIEIDANLNKETTRSTYIFHLIDAEDTFQISSIHHLISML